MHVFNLKYKCKKAKDYVLNGVTFTLNTKKLNVIVGLNGAGKTTLFDCLTGNLTPETGEISLPDKKEMLYLTQNIFFSPEIKGKDFAKFVARLSGKKGSNQIDDYLDFLDSRERELMAHLWSMKIGKMSVGERKWLFIALLSSIERKLYIFDEPTSGVDPSSRLKIMNKFKKLIENQRICIISTHQLQDLSYIDSHLILLHKGKVLYEGDFQDWLKLFNTINPDEAFARMIEQG
ncbi:ABC transporter ATP-binding protein [Heyndrickxia coagulans]|uniref:ATP-binding cassette domain-containing protein n=1 Tax=Heyndrickxia coagulans TaxID=1398 RepID=UPI0021F1C8DC|nr:ABC transporter ATP-binding protein [Heyndrickxia coagulans]UYM81484.1 ABC transporter ATP-binding protein [Heyndrickxia coagulans]